MAKRPLTFEAFRATRQWCEDLRTTPYFESFDDDMARQWDSGERLRPSGNLYLGSLIIEEVQPDWPNNARDDGRWHLIISNAEYISDDLEALERRLFVDHAFGEYNAEDAINTLIKEYGDWTKANGLPELSADEHDPDDLTKEQNDYLRGFLVRWETVTRPELTRPDLEALARAALPYTDSDWGSERQITAENALFDAARRFLTSQQMADLEAYALKATTEEMVEEVLRLTA
jgi:hypothetical protein